LLKECSKFLFLTLILFLSPLVKRNDLVKRNLEKEKVGRLSELLLKSNSSNVFSLSYKPSSW